MIIDELFQIGKTYIVHGKIMNGFWSRDHFPDQHLESDVCKDILMSIQYAPEFFENEIKSRKID